MRMSIATIELRELRLRDNVWTWTAGGDRVETSYGANCTAVVGQESVLVVDPLIAPAFARRVEDALASKTSLPVRHVVLTHHHTDHALGASWFGGKGAAVLAHPACRAAMAAEHPGLVDARRRIPELEALFRDAEPHVPGSLVEDEERIDLGGTTALVFHPGPGHTRGDLVVHFARESLAVCGDLASVGYHVNYEDAVLDGLARGLDELSRLAASTFVPGHGPPGGPEILEHQRGYHEAVARARDAGEIAGRYPGYALEELLPHSLAVWGRRGA